MNNLKSGKAVIKAVLTAAGLVLLVLILIPVFKSMSLDKKIERANDNAKIIYDGAQKWLDEIKLQGISLSLSSSTLNFRSESISSLKSDMVVENDFVVMDLSKYVSKRTLGDWYVVVNPQEYTIVYALWSEAEISKDMLNKISDKISQKESVKKTGDIIGCYPISSGTYKD